MSAAARVVFVALGAAVLAGGCARKETVELAAKPGQTWNVFKGDRKVLILKNEPGPITSTALPEPGTQPARHPFLTGSALYAPEEGALHDLLVESTGFDDFLKRLQAKGYRLEPEQ